MDSSGSHVVPVDFRYVLVDHELWALGEMLRVVESSIEQLATRYETVRLDELRQSGFEDDEAERSFAYQDVHEMREYILPRLVRGPFVVALWATFEVGITVIAGDRAKEVGAGIRLDDLRGDLLGRASKYFPTVLRIAFDDDPVRIGRLKALYAVRNAFAHANGRREAISPGQWRELEAILDGGMFDDSKSMIMLSEEYIRGAYHDVAGSLRDLLARARLERPQLGGGA